MNAPAPAVGKAHISQRYLCALRKAHERRDWSEVILIPGAGAL